MKNLLDIIDSKKFLRITTILFGVVIVFLLVDIYHKKNNFITEQNNIGIRDQEDKYVFTNPILDCEAVEQGYETVIPRQDVYNKIESIKKNNNINFISVYFRDLNNGPWIGINEKEYFLPASLLKTPYFISFLRNLQDDPSIKNKKVLITEEDAKASLEQNIKSVVVLEQGKEYTLGEIAEHTIKYSDNAAFSALIKNVTSKYVYDVYDVLGNLYSLENDELSVRVKDAASFFRVLYNSSYLNREMSEYALKIFSETAYNNGLVAGVPKNVKVAHKFGERSDPTLSMGGVNVVQLHDCGIIYYPGKPYMLCIMTRGINVKSQEKSIAEISKYFYDKIDKEN